MSRPARRSTGQFPSFGHTGGTVGAQTSMFASEAEAPFELLLRNAVRALYRHRWLLFWTTAIVTVVSILAVKVLPATYVAEARVLVRTESIGSPAYLSGVATVGNGLGAETPERQLETEMQLAASRGVIERAVRETHASYDQVFHSPLTHWLSPAIDAYAWIKEHWMGAPHFDRKNESATVDAVSKSLGVALVRSKGAEVSSNLIAFTLPAADAGVAQTLLDSIVQRYLTLQSDLAGNTAREALASVEREADRATAEADSIRGQLQRFLARGGSGTAAAAEAEPGANGQELDRLKASLFAAETDLRDARSRYLENADTVVRLVQRVQFINGRIAEVARRNVREGTGADVLRQQLRAAELRQTELKRRVDQIALTVSSAPTAMDNRVLIEPPLRPSTSDWKKRAAYIVLGFIAGVLLGIVLLTVREVLSNSVRTADDLRQYFGVAPAVVIPRLRVTGSQQLRRVSAKGSAARDELDGASHRLAVRVRQFADSLGLFDEPRRREGVVIFVANVHAGSGATTVARGLAGALDGMVASASSLADVPAAVARTLPEWARERAPQAAQFENEAGQRSNAAALPAGLSEASSDLMRVAGERPSVRRSIVPAEVDGERAADGTPVRYRWTVVDASALDADIAQELNAVADIRVLVVDATRSGRQAVRDAISDLVDDSAPTPLLVLNRVEKQPPAFLLNRW